MADHEKDESIERLLRQSRAGESALSGPGPCLDAETLAAWVDGGLASDALALAEAHASECARCQAMVVVLMKQPIAAQAAEERHAWRSGIRWLVPLAAGVAAVGLWFVVPQPATRTTAPRPDAQARFEAPAPVVPAQPPASI